MGMLGQLATKEDIAGLEDRFDWLEDRISRMDDRFHDFYKGILVTVVSSMTALTGIFAALLTVVR